MLRASLSEVGRHEPGLGRLSTRASKDTGLLHSHGKSKESLLVLHREASFVVPLTHQSVPQFPYMQKGKTIVFCSLIFHIWGQACGQFLSPKDSLPDTKKEAWHPAATPQQ